MHGLHIRAVCMEPLDISFWSDHNNWQHAAQIIVFMSMSLNSVVQLIHGSLCVTQGDKSSFEFFLTDEMIMTIYPMASV